MRKALLPGSFDPLTLGHLDLIERASHLFDALIIGITENQAKKQSSLFTIQERSLFLKEATGHLHNVEIMSFSGLTVDFAKKHNVICMVRGLRNGLDFESEQALALANRKLKGIETLFLAASPDTLHISSSLIRDIANAKGPLEAFLPQAIIDRVRTKVSH